MVSVNQRSAITEKTVFPQRGVSLPPTEQMVSFFAGVRSRYRPLYGHLTYLFL